MTIKEVYEWAKKKGYDEFDFNIYFYNGGREFDPNSDLNVDEKDKEIFIECEC